MSLFKKKKKPETDPKKLNPGSQIIGANWYTNSAWQGELIYLGGNYFCSIRGSTLLFQYHRHFGEIWSVCYTKNKRFVLIGTFWDEDDNNIPRKQSVARVLPLYEVRDLFFEVYPGYLLYRHPNFVLKSWKV